MAFTKRRYPWFQILAKSNKSIGCGNETSMLLVYYIIYCHAVFGMGYLHYNISWRGLTALLIFDLGNARSPEPG